MKSFIYHGNHINKDMAGSAPSKIWQLEVEKSIKDFVIANFERLEKPETADQIWKEMYSSFSLRYSESNPQALNDEQDMYILDRISYWQEREMPFLSCIGSYRAFIIKERQLPGKGEQWKSFLREYIEKHPESSEPNHNIFA